MQLTPVMHKFILHWGEMGARWGISRTIAQIHALLYLAPEPLPADEIAQTLNVARSNVSTSLRELQTWGIVRVVHVLGDRRDRFETMTDVWEMFQIILDERKRREVDPTLNLLRDCLAEAEGSREETEQTRHRLAEMVHFFETMTNWYTQIRTLPQGAVIRFARMGRKVRKLLGVAS